jgi:hypothetical protein
MFPELIDALKAHIKNNIPKDSLRLDTINAGYSNEEFEAAYTKALTVIQTETTVIPAAPAVPVRPDFTAVLPIGIVSNVPPVVQVATPPPQTATTVDRSHRAIYPIIAFVVLLLAVVGVTVAFASQLFHLPTFLSGLFGRAPYAETEMLQDIAQGATSITSAQFTLALSAKSAPLDADVYLLPEALKKELGDTAGLLGLLPKDFTLNADVSGQFDTKTKLPETSTKIAGEYITPDFTANVDVELILSQDKGAYVRVNRMPSLFMLDLSAIRGQWVHIIEEPLTSMAGNFASTSEADKAKGIVQLKLFLTTADKNQIFKMVGAPVSEKVGDTSAFRYTLILNQAGLKPFFTELKSTLDAQYGAGGHFLSKLTQENIDLFTSAAFVDYANVHTQYHVWAGSDGVPLQFEIVTRTAIDDDAKVSPFGSVSPNDRKISALTSARTSAELYRTRSKNSYAGLCAANFRFYQSFYPDWGLNCHDATTTYAVAVRMDQGSYCIDSSGYTGYGTTTAAALMVCTHEAEPVKPVVEVKPERQVNTSVKLTLNHINEPVAITIPGDALTRDAATKLVPMLQFLVPGGKKNSDSNSTFPVGIPDTNSVSARRDTALDASLKAKLSGARASAEIYFYSKKSSYKGFCLTADAPKGVGISCLDTTTKYVLFTTLSTGNTYCVDATGYGADIGLVATSSLTKIKTTMLCK